MPGARSRRHSISSPVSFPSCCRAALDLNSVALCHPKMACGTLQRIECWNCCYKSASPPDLARAGSSGTVALRLLWVPLAGFAVSLAPDKTLLSYHRLVPLQTWNLCQAEQVSPPFCSPMPNSKGVRSGKRGGECGGVPRFRKYVTKAANYIPSLSFNEQEL